MPHIGIKMLAGRSEEQKKKAAEAVKNALVEALGMGSDHYVTCTIEDFDANEWQTVFKQEVTDKPDKVYVKPKYDPKSLL
ncbi:MAG: tautomerase family protein [Ruminiclostridium sp.]|nr:tautomerase family protein [Ruminiclostridium sp.]